MNVIKATLKALHGGRQPIKMTSSELSKVPRLEKGGGMRTAQDIAMERGRQLVYIKKESY